MSVRRLHEQQPEAFAFSEDNLVWAGEQIEILVIFLGMLYYLTT